MGGILERSFPRCEGKRLVFTLSVKSFLPDSEVL